MSYKVSGPCPDDWSLAQKLILRGCEPLPRRRCFAKTVPKTRSKNDFLIDDVLAMGIGGIRIGFDIGSGSGTFAARMSEKNVTVLTNTLHTDAPYAEFIAARGLLPLFLSFDHRFPFYDNVFDLVHATTGLDVGGKPEKLEFLMFDIDRILRAGGLFWLDNIYCANDEKKRTLTRLIERFRYKKMKWVIGEKIDAGGSGKPELYLSAVLQKPVRV
ncbi:auxin response factor 5-like isoform X1 [Hibiscus syriacus]|uniref:Auxin response factor 5-like isoform X1 n=1 Tax=Hibiscus syriacus TaxID=106335 RepID=A0A6A3B641_HIBSY|nr:auxin response factor 5-like isoform X1 [Hibiscus syriacus]